ncbi:tyrosine recombinase XerC [Parvibium lacunae]|uniref:Tyrosine recombinase XerC n=1 Tax=Parvibium lacunae TaxID=1888893 RepID=A0A368L583_9BURK|nr:tyrosine recombinase XerC [Parvibium lacunae]RCS58633.1 tyrosine recombinase XerC [Parvibium lacunae]
MDTSLPPAAAPNPNSPTPARYLTHLRVERRLSPRTLANYTRDLGLLEAKAADRAWHDITQHDIRLWASKRHAEGADGKTIAAMLSCWRGFFTWLCEQGLCTHNPVQGVRAPKTGQRLPKALSADMAQQLLNSPTHLPTRSPSPQALSEQEVEGVETVEDDHSVLCRDQAMMELLYSAGLRISELVGLDVQPIQTRDYQSLGYVDMPAALVTVVGKGQKRRTVPVGSVALAALEKWLSARAQWPHVVCQEALFLSARGLRISPVVVRQRLALMAQRAGLPTHVHPHMLRHSFASHILQSSGDLRAVQELLGHANISTTQIYTRLDWQHLAKAYDAAHPRAKKQD